MHPIFSEGNVTAFIAGSFALATVLIPIYLKNRRSMRKVSAEEFIENFMKRQEQEISQKKTLIAELETELAQAKDEVKRLQSSSYKKDVSIAQYRITIKDLREEIKSKENHSAKLRVQLEQMKDDYTTMTGNKIK